MTSAPITDVKSTLMGNIGNTAKGLEVQNVESFSKVFDKTQTPATNKTDSTVKKVEDVESIQNHANIQKNKTSENLKEQTEEVVDLEEYKKTMQNIYTTSVTEETKDEAPFVYKPIEEILGYIVPTVEVTKIVKPVYNFKSKEA